MTKPVLQVKGYTAESIKALMRKDEGYTIGLKLYAIYQVAKGQSSRKLEELYNTNFKQITNWVHRFEADLHQQEQFKSTLKKTLRKKT